MSDSSIIHPNDTPVSRIDILKMKREELVKYVEKIQANRESVFKKRDTIKSNIKKARYDDTCAKIEGILVRIQKKLDKADALITDVADLFTRTRALELEIEYLDALEVPEEKNEDATTEMDSE